MFSGPFSRSAPFDVVLTGLVLAVGAWALLALAVMTSLAPLARVVSPPGVTRVRSACAPADTSSPYLACRAQPGESSSP